MISTVLKVKIKPTDNPHAWYCSFAGQIFEVTPIRDGYILAQDKGPEIRCIRAEDCTIVKG
jgi:hypothetical protein